MKKFFGIIGNPIKHSLSPVLHKYWFKKYGINASYSTMELKDNELPEVIKRIKDKRENNNLVFDILNGFNYENKTTVGDLLNPINFFLWLVVSFKDIF